MSMLVRRPSPDDELFLLRQAVDRPFDPQLARPFAADAAPDESDAPAQA